MHGNHTDLILHNELFEYSESVYLPKFTLYLKASNTKSSLAIPMSTTTMSTTFVSKATSKIEAVSTATAPKQ